MGAIVLFDGVCNFCNGSVNFIIAHDKAGYFKFSPLQSEIGEELTAKYGVDKDGHRFGCCDRGRKGIHAFLRSFADRRKARRHMVVDIRT